MRVAPWQPVSLLGERDFHVLEAAGPRVYGYGSDFESRQAGLLVSDDGGRSWEGRTPPEPLLSLAIDPGDPERVVASGENGLHASTDTRAGLELVRLRPGEHAGRVAESAPLAPRGVVSRELGPARQG